MAHAYDARPVACHRVFVYLDTRAGRIPRSRIATVFDFVAIAARDFQRDSSLVILVHLHPDVFQSYSGGMVNNNSIGVSTDISDREIFQTRPASLNANRRRYLIAGTKIREVVCGERHFGSAAIPVWVVHTVDRNGGIEIQA